MRLRSPLLALLGLLAIGAIAIQLLTHHTTISQAGLRVAVAVGVLVAVDRIGVPLARALVGPAREESEEPAPEA